MGSVLGGGGGGSTSSTTTVNVPPPTAAELALQEVNLATAQVLFDDLVIASDLQNNVLLPLFAQQAGVIIERAPAAAPGTTAPTTGTGAAAPAGNIGALQSQLAQLNQQAAAQRENLTEEGQPGPVDNRTQRQIDAVQAQISTATTAGTTAAGTTGAQAATAGPAPGAITGFSLTPGAQERLDLSQQLQTAGLEAQLSATEAIPALAQTLLEETPEFSLEEAISFIEAASQSAIASGENEILQFQTLALENLRDVIAPARGLRPSDSPIGGFAAGEVLRESTRQQGQLVRDVTTTSESLKVNAQQFQASLEQAAFVNRSNLLGQLGNLGLGFPATPAPGQHLAPIGAFGANLATSAIPGAGLQASLAAQRTAAAPRSTTSTGGGGNVLGGLAGLAVGLGSLGFNPFGASTAAAASAAPSAFGIQGGNFSGFQF